MRDGEKSRIVLVVVEEDPLNSLRDALPDGNLAFFMLNPKQDRRCAFWNA